MRRALLVMVVLATMFSVSSPLPAQAVSWHDDGEVFVRSQPWHNPANGRDYRFWARVGIQHEPAYTSGDFDFPDRWRVDVEVGCERSYGNQTVATACNIDLWDFKAEEFTARSGGTLVIRAQANPSDRNCVTTSGYTGVFRNVNYNYPWVLAYLGGLQVRFLDSLTSCRSLHLSQKYAVGSYRVNVYRNSFAYEQLDWDDLRTGLRNLN
jgi:hypothetical protein